MNHLHLLSVFCLVRTGLATELQALPEHLRPAPFGGIAAADRYPGAGPFATVELHVPRASYVSFHLVATSAEPLEFEIGVRVDDRSGKIEIEA